MRQLPLSGVRMPLNTLMVLLFPAPLGPMYPTISPSPMVKLTSSRARISSYSRWNSAFTAWEKPAPRRATRKVFRKWETWITLSPPLAAQRFAPENTSPGCAKLGSTL